MTQVDFSQYKPEVGHVLCLKTVNNDLTAQYNKFKWPEAGECVAPDWQPTQTIGNGLHALLWGAGDGPLLSTDIDAKWLVLSVNESCIIDLKGKVKFPSCEVVFCGSKETAVAIIQHFAPTGTQICYGTATAGDYGTATAGYKGTATAGYKGTATAGYKGTATAGDYGTATAGYKGTATAGDYGTATAGTEGTATAGNYGTATAGDYGTAMAGDYGIIIIRYYDSVTSQLQRRIGVINGIDLLPNVKYHLNETHEFEPVLPTNI